MELEKIEKSLEEVLNFDGLVIMSQLSGEKISNEKIEEIRKACDILTEAKLFEFNTDCSFEELIVQIHKFVEKGLNGDV